METFESPPLSNTNRPSLHWPSAVQMVFSLLATLGMWGAALLFVNTAWRLLQIEATSDIVGAYNITPSLMMAASMALCGALALPSAWHAWRHLRSKAATAVLQSADAGLPARQVKPAVQGCLLSVGFVLALGVGGALSAHEGLARWFLPPLHLVAIGLPVLGVLSLARYRLPSGSPQRIWGLFSAGLFLGPGLIIVMEMLAAMGILIVGSVYVVFQPDLARDLQVLADQVEAAGSNLDVILPTLAPFLLRADVGFAVFAFAAILVPLIEELIKPIGVWLLAGRRLTPAEGFVAGVLSGAGFALIESLGYAGNSREGWAMMAAMRAGTAIMHMLASGLTGWGLASAWSQARYARLAVGYLGAVALHGLWNGLAVLAAGASLITLTGGEISPMMALAVAAEAGGLLLLTVVALGSLIGINALLRRGLPPQPTVPEVIPVLVPYTEQAGVMLGADYPAQAVAEQSALPEADIPQNEKGVA